MDVAILAQFFLHPDGETGIHLLSNVRTYMHNINNIVHDTALRLKEIRGSKGVSQSKFAGFLGVSLRSYQYYESGSRPIPIDLLRGLAEMGTNIHWLLTGKGDMLLKGRNEVEEQKLLAEYWQTNHRLIEMALKIAYQRVVDNFGQERAEKIFKEVIPSPQVEVAFPHPAGKVHDAGAVAEEEKKQEKGSHNKS